MTAEEFRQLLTKHVVAIIFTKKDGSERRLVGTTSPRIFEAPADFGGHPLKPDIINVYSLDDEGWRSFYFDKMISYKIVQVA